jgi:epoxide hydrolase 4
VIEHHHAEINGIRMHYCAAGDGEVVLFLHGFPEYWGIWKKLVADLSRDYRAVAPDQRGYDLTTRPREVESYHVDFLVEDIRALIDHLGQNSVHLVTQDWGALVGWSFMLRYPAYVKRFVTIGMTHPAIFNRLLATPGRQQEASRYMLAFRSAQGEDLIMADDFAFLKNAIYVDALREGYATQEDLEEHMAAWRQPGAITAGLNWYRAARIGPPDELGNPGGSNLLDGLAPESFKVRAPVLFLCPEKDPYLLPDGLEGIEELVPDITIERIPDGGHWATLQKPALVAARIREFLAR